MASFKKQLSELYIRANLEKYINNLKKDEEKEKYTAYLYIILTLFTVSFFGVFAINPTLSTISNLQKQYDDNKSVDSALETKINALNNLSMEYEQITPLLDAINSAIPNSPEIPYLTRKIEKLAVANSLSITRFNVGQIEIFPANKKGQALYSYLFNVLVEGKNDNINNFISDIINFDRVVSIDSISTEKSQDTNQVANISGRVYFMK